MEHFHIHLDEKTEPQSENLQPIRKELRKHTPIEYILLVIAGLWFLFPVSQFSTRWYGWFVFPATIFATTMLPVWQAFGRANFILRTSISAASVFGISLTIKYIFTGWDSLPYWFLFNTELGLLTFYCLTRLIGFDIRRTVLTAHGQRVPIPEAMRKYQFSLSFLFQLTLLVAITIALSKLTEAWQYVFLMLSSRGIEWEFFMGLILLMAGHIAGTVSLLASRKSLITFIVLALSVFGMQLRMFHTAGNDVGGNLYGFFFCAPLFIFPLLILRFVGYRWSWHWPWSATLGQKENRSDENVASGRNDSLS